MKAIFLFSVTALLAGELRLPAADAVELNGISALGKEKLACFLLYQPSADKPRSFMLAEGESKYGFKLLAVDVAGHQVLVEKCGVKKYVHINSTPELIATDKSEAATPEATSSRVVMPDGSSLASYFASDETARIQAGNPLLLATVIPGATKNSNNGSSAAPGAGNAGSNAGNGGNTSSNTGNPSAGGPNGVADQGAGSQNTSVGASGGNSNSSANPSASSSGAAADPNNTANQLWYQESLSIEQSRAMTADDVLSGRLSPFPRTPLTPSATPSQLVGEDVYFSDHIPGYQVTGYLNQ